MQQDDAAPVGVESKITTFLTQKGQPLAAIVLILLLMTTVFTLYQSHLRKGKTEDLFHAHELAFKLDHPEQKQALKELEKLALRHPSIRAIYQSTIAHTKLKQHWTKEKNIILSPFSHLQSPLKGEEELFRQYSLTSYTIASGNYEKALSESLQLKELIQESTQELSTLELFLALRLSSLHHQLGQREKAKESWFSLLEKKEQKPEIFSQFAAHLQEGSLEIEEFPIYTH